MREKSDKEKALQLLWHPEGLAFERYHEAFARDGALMEEAKDYSTVKAELIEEFGNTLKSEEELQKDINSRLDPKYLLGSLAQLEDLYKRVGFNDAA